MLEVLYNDSLCGKRENNQDALLVKKYDNGDMLLAVADGMGGGVMGAELAQKSMSMLNDFFDTSVEYPKQKLKQAVYTINDTLHEMLDGQKGGTTLCVVYYKQGKVFYLNVGDSRLSICGEKKLKNITLDQNMYEYKKLNDLYVKEEDKRFVYKILGISSNFEIDEVLENKEWSAFGQEVLTYPLDTLILSTDGFHDYIDQEMSCSHFQGHFQSILSDIESKSQDNITTIVAKELL